MALFAALLATVAGAPAADATHGFEIIRTVAGNGTEVSSGDGGPATEAGVFFPVDVVVAPDGSFYIVEVVAGLVRKVDPSGVITTVAGGGDSLEDGVLATTALLSDPTGVALDTVGNLYISTQGVGPGGQRVRKVAAGTGVITTVAGTGVAADGADGGLATETPLFNPVGLVVDGDGNLFIAEGKRVRLVDAATGIITTVAGAGDEAFGVVGEGGPATDAYLDFATDVDLDGEGNLFIVDSGGNIPGSVRKVDLATGIITTVAGGVSRGGGDGDGGPATAAFLNDPYSVALDGTGGFYVSERGGARVRRVDPSGIITTVAGTGVEGFSGDGGPPRQAQLGGVFGLDYDATLGLLFAEFPSFRVRQVTSVPDLLAVTQSDAPDPVNVGQQITYSIKVSNNDGLATAATVTNQLAPEVDFVSAGASQGSCSEAERTVTCRLGDLAPDSEATITIVVTANATGTTTNTITVAADENDPFPSNNRATTETRVGAPGCAQVITANTKLTADLGPCPGDGIIIGRDNVTLDLGGHTVFGFPGPGDGTSAGVRLPARTQATVKNGTVSGFDAGVVLNGGRSNTLRSLKVRDNVGPDNAFLDGLGDGIVLFDSAFNRIFDNVVVGNGVFDGIGVLGDGADGNRIYNNLVKGNIGPSDGGPAGQGIIVNGTGDSGEPTTITGTRIFDNKVLDNGSAGIANISNVEASIERNVVKGNGLTNAQGNGIGVQLGIRNTGTATHVLVRDNEVRGNGFDGIQVATNAHENRIINNISTNNGVLYGGAGLFFFDLNDQNENCDSNIWRGNKWGNAFYSPPCAAIGGRGPVPPPAAAAQRSVGRPGERPAQEQLPPTRTAPGR